LVFVGPYPSQAKENIFVGVDDDGGNIPVGPSEVYQEMKKKFEIIGTWFGHYGENFRKENFYFEIYER